MMKRPGTGQPSTPCLKLRCRQMVTCLLLTGHISIAAVRIPLQVGIPVLVLEREASLRLEGSAIAMWSNAFRALDALGVGDALRCSHPLLERCGTWRPTLMMRLWDPAPVMQLKTVNAAWTAPLGMCIYRMHLGQTTPHHAPPLHPQDGAVQQGRQAAAGLRLQSGLRGRPP